MSRDPATHDEELDNLVNKYRLLNAPQISIREEGSERKILIPLFKEKEVPL
jgi:hypothetical protein